MKPNESATPTTEVVNPKTGEVALAAPLMLSEWEILKEQAVMLVKSGFLKPALNTAEKVMAVALKGKELGIPMMEALSKIDIIQGNPTVAPQLMLALALRTGQVESHDIESNEKGATFTIKRKGDPKPHVAHFGVKEATDLQLMGKDNYKKQPVTMFEWRAIAKGLRFKFPDAISGLYTPDEMGLSTDEDGTTHTVTTKGAVAMPKPLEKSKPVETETVS